jgi:4-amino-4-deoxy-L-arabinose transferase-like glycosyltransferase/Flp pilus assembly protein TadD
MFTRIRGWVRHPPVLAALVHVILAVAHLVYLSRSPLLTHLTVDLQGYDRWAREIASGDWLGQGVFYQDPLYPYFLAGVYLLTGTNVVHALLFQIILSTATVFLVYRLALPLFSARTALLSAWLMALSGPAIYYAAKPEKACLSAFGLTLFLVWLFEAIRDPSFLRFLKAGVSLGLVALLRGNALLIGALLLLLLAMSRISGKDPVTRRRALAGFALGLSLILLPVLIRNRLVGGEWIVTTSQAGANLYVGNNAENVTGSYIAPTFVRPSPRFEEEDFHRNAERIEGRPLRSREVSDFYVREVIRWAMHDPASFVRLQVIKMAAFLNAYEIPDNWSFYFVRRFSPILRLPLATFGIVAPLAVLGAVLVLFRRPRSREPLLFVLLALAYAVSIIIFYVFSRYRFPIVPALAILAAHAVTMGIDWIRTRQWKALGSGAAILVMAGIITFLPPRIDPASDLSHRFFNLASSYFEEGRFEECESLCREALVLDPGNGLALYLLSRIAGYYGDEARERRLLLEAQASRPGDDEILASMMRANVRHGGYPEAERFAVDWLAFHESYRLRRTLVELALGEGLIDSARKQLERIVEIYPADTWALEQRRRMDPGAHAGRETGSASESREIIRHVRRLSDGRQYDEALKVLETAIEGNPADPVLYQSLSNIYYLMGNRLRAREALGKALELDPENPLYRRNLRALDE